MMACTLRNRVTAKADFYDIIKKLSSKKIVFGKVRYLLTTEAAILLFKSCIQLLFDYNDFMYLLLAKDKCK